MKIYHATWPTNVESILADGIDAGWDERVYFANKPGYAAGFLNLRGGQIIGEKEVEVAGLKFKVPDIVTHDQIAVIEVDTALLSESDLEAGGDHNPEFYPDDLEVVAHVGNVPSSAILRILTYERQ
jgi:hypothetical protein